MTVFISMSLRGELHRKSWYIAKLQLRHFSKDGGFKGTKARRRVGDL